ncbi:hypothetical protein L1987_61854 [Smallanthus sonchifolius]|uniref:Uncharacterized protein n=1 Tax=Smallanthus sonchifolius TaxID=185202 RepID=A0ACB9C8Q7_9ASTR|nr:hypothetical protein L1987_61854 [Smallanthus sonchifolius]
MTGEGATPPVNNQIVTIRENSTIPLQCPVLTAMNYTLWAVKLKSIFNVHGLWEVIEVQEGVEVDSKKNNMAIAYLYQAMPEDLVLQVAKYTKAKEIWDSLKSRFVRIGRVKKARLQTLRNEFEGLRMKEEESIDDFFGRIGAISSKASDLGAPYEDTTLVRKFLDSLPEKFIQIVASVEQFVDLDTMLLQEAIGRLKAFEERTCLKAKVSQTKSDQLLLTYAEWQARTKDSESNNRYKSKSDQGEKGWVKNKGQFVNKGKSDKFKKQGKEKSKIKYFKCDLYGHYASECPTKAKDVEANLTQTE